MRYISPPFASFVLAFLTLSACGTSDNGPSIAHGAGGSMSAGGANGTSPDSGAPTTPISGTVVGAGSDSPVEVSAQLVKSNCAPSAATADGKLMTFNVRGTNGIFDAYIGNTRCDGQPLLPSYDGHRGAGDMTPDGRYVLLVVARGWDKATSGAEPGKGSSNSIDILDRDTGVASTLVPSYCDKCQRGAIWPRFSPDGTKIVWTEMVQSPLESSPIGRWTLHVSTLNADRTAVASDVVWKPRTTGSVLVEAYGWLPGTSDVVFDTNDGVTDCNLTTCLQLFRLSDQLPDAAPTLLTPPVNGSNAYHEFAHFRGDGWVYTSIGRDGLGADLWRMKPDGSSQERVTFFGGAYSLAKQGFAQVEGFPDATYSIVGGMAAVPGGFIAGVIHDDNATNIDAFRIDLVPR